MLQIVNGGLGPRVFGQVEPKISRVLQALATYVEAETSWTVMILRPSTKPANMGSDRPLSLRPNGAELPLFLVNCSSGGAAFECSVSGIAREELGLAIDALNRARGKSKKFVEVEPDVKVIALAACEAVVGDQLSTDSTPQSTDSPERAAILKGLGESFANEVPKLEDFMLEIWEQFSDRAKDGIFFS